MTTQPMIKNIDKYPHPYLQAKATQAFNHMIRSQGILVGV